MKGEAFRTAGGRHRTALALLIVLLGVLLSGCLHAQASLTIAEDDTVSGEVLLSTQTADGQVPFQLRPPEELADQVNVTPYSRQGRVGSRLEFQDLTFDEVEELAAKLSHENSRYTFELRRAGSLVLFNGSVDLTPLDETDSAVEIEVSTPGETTTTNGHETAGVVTWRPEPGQVTQLAAAFQYTGSGPPYWLWWLLLVVALSFGAAGAVGYLAQRSHEQYHRPPESEPEREEPSLSR